MKLVLAAKVYKATTEIEVPFQFSLDGELDQTGYASVSLDEEEKTYEIGRLSNSDIDSEWPMSDVRDWMAEHYPNYTEIR